ncbi:MAG: ABC transporter permease, partial [Muribaculaceae bacterium]|nr:ABC transporter permease [Muribaculaceae bacterium]
MNCISEWFAQMTRVWCREFRLVFSDIGIILFFIGLPLFYPIVYTLIYNPEVPENIAVAVVDNCRTSGSRELVRHIDAAPAIKIIGYASSMSEARKWMNEKNCYGILEIPEDYSRKLGRQEQAIVPFYSEMSLLLRYRSFISALTDVQLATGAEIRSQLISEAGLSSLESGTPVNSEAFFLGDTEQGFASFVIPGIVILILQQSMVLGITMLAGTASERRRRNGGVDPLAIKASPSASVIGKMLCYIVIYLPMTFYVLHFIPMMFSLPHIGNMADYMLFILPMLIASSFFGMLVGGMVKEREMSLMVVVFTSLIFLFLSGLTWPRYAMGNVWYWLGNCI